MNIEDVWSDWQVEKIIGRGSYGTVYKCFKDSENSKEYSAVKVISVPQDNYEINSFDSNGMTNEQTKDYYKDIVDEFIGEIKILESLKNNKNIVNIFDSKVVEKEDGIGWQIFIRMELLTDFNSYTATKEMKAEDILKLGTDLCEALKVCNEKKIIHRDIKPENIFVDNEGNFKLGDFGVAKQLEKTEMSMSRKGTYNYMAPEVFNSKKYDSRADIYSLGLVMYRLFNRNRLPFLDPNKQIIKYSEREEAFEKRIRGEKIPPISGIDENINALLLRACAYKQDDRYRTVEEFENAITGISKGKKIRKSIKQIIASPIGIAIITVILVISIVSGIFVYSSNKKDTDNFTPLKSPVLEKKEEKVTKIKYSGMCNGVYTYDGIDYCAGYDGNFYAVSATEKKKLSDQRVTTEFTIINDKIYYTVIDNVKKEYSSLYNYTVEWAQCSCWVMDLDGKNSSKIFDYDGSGNVIWANDKNIYYSDDPQASVYNCAYYRSVKKYDLTTKTSSTIVSATHYAESVSEEETGCPNIFYYNGFILCGGASEDFGYKGGKVYRYSITEEKLETLNIKTNDKIIAFENGLFYIINRVKSIENAKEAYSDNLIEYDIINNKIKTIVENGKYYIEGTFENKLLLSCYSDDNDIKYCTYDNNKFEWLEDLEKTLNPLDNFLFQWTQNGIFLVEEKNFSEHNAYKISLINGTNKKVLAIEQGKNTFQFIGCGEHIALFADEDYENVLHSAYGIDYSLNSDENKINVTVPNFEGEEYEDVKDFIEFLGFKAKIKNEYPNDGSVYNEGIIMSQNIELDKPIAYGSEITLTLSKGLEDVEIAINNMPIMDGKHNIKIKIGGYVVEDKNDVVLNGGSYTIKLHPKVSDDKIYFQIEDELVLANNELAMFIDDNRYFDAQYYYNEGLFEENYYPLGDESLM